jgi:hypothetical protein
MSKGVVCARRSPKVGNRAVPAWRAFFESRRAGLDSCWDANSASVGESNRVRSDATAPDHWDLCDAGAAILSTSERQQTKLGYIGRLRGARYATRLDSLQIRAIRVLEPRASGASGAHRCAPNGAGVGVLLHFGPHPKFYRFVDSIKKHPRVDGSLDKADTPLGFIRSDR